MNLTGSDHHESSCWGFVGPISDILICRCCTVCLIFFSTSVLPLESNLDATNLIMPVKVGSWKVLLYWIVMCWTKSSEATAKSISSNSTNRLNLGLGIHSWHCWQEIPPCNLDVNCFGFSRWKNTLSENSKLDACIYSICCGRWQLTNWPQDFFVFWSAWVWLKLWDDEYMYIYIYIYTLCTYIPIGSMYGTFTDMFPSPTKCRHIYQSDGSL